MEEKIYTGKKNGMAVLLLSVTLYVVAIAGIIITAVSYDRVHITPVLVIMVLCIVYASLGWIPFLGLKVLKPQEALVLTLFGNYVGTIREAGFYFVNPFCTAVRPCGVELFVR